MSGVCGEIFNGKYRTSDAYNSLSYRVSIGKISPFFPCLAVAESVILSSVSLMCYGGIFMPLTATHKRFAVPANQVTILYEVRKKMKKFELCSNQEAVVTVFNIS